MLTLLAYLQLARSVRPGWNEAHASKCDTLDIAANHAPACGATLLTTTYTECCHSIHIERFNNCYQHYYLFIIVGSYNFRMLLIRSYVESVVLFVCSLAQLFDKFTAMQERLRYIRWCAHSAPDVQSPSYSLWIRFLQSSRVHNDSIEFLAFDTLRVQSESIMKQIRARTQIP